MQKKYGSCQKRQKTIDETMKRNVASSYMLNVREDTSTGLLLQDSLRPCSRKCLEENNEVTTRSAAPQRTSNVREDASTGLLLQDSLQTFSPFGIYIHWPFCLSKCPYCDFFSKVKKEDEQDKLIDEYCKDLEFYAEITGNRTVTSVFFGGGTPSLIRPENIEKLLDKISGCWKLSADVEISLEANPNTHTPTLFSDLKQAGINRLSLGVQALNDRDLKFLGRTHNAVQAVQSVKDIIQTFDNHSIDLIYALPDQNIQAWQNTLKQAVSFGLKHISLYQLTIEDGTVFAKKGIQALDDEQAIKLYEYTNAFLAEAGYPRYEVSNYASQKYQSRHNLIYWQGDDYLGIGPAAHGRLNVNGSCFATTYRRQQEQLTAGERAQELIIMGLRLTEGINKIKFKRCCGIALDDFINKKAAATLIEDKLLEETATCLRASEKGFAVLNKIIEELCS